ncbi:FCD domain-containing protein [Streptomyces sp. NBC_01186]|uniref:FCD domain-containing protein n=1 Tax=Streptomyces sp. NBC_01186 TaxID=2903765 RepID=UPI003FA7DAE2
MSGCWPSPPTAARGRTRSSSPRAGSERAQEARAGGVRAETDRAFHSALYAGLGDSPPSAALDAFWDAFHRLRTDLAELRLDPLVTRRQHAEILAAVRSGDIRRTEEAVRDHFGNIRERLRSTPSEVLTKKPHFDDSSVTSASPIPPHWR